MFTPDLKIEVSFGPKEVIVTSDGFGNDHCVAYISSTDEETEANTRDFVKKSLMDFMEDALDAEFMKRPFLKERQNP